MRWLGGWLRGWFFEMMDWVGLYCTLESVVGGSLFCSLCVPYFYVWLIDRTLHDDDEKQNPACDEN